MPAVLILAYGNPLRSDDGVAWRSAERLQNIFSADDLEIVCLHQLGPELSESFTRRKCVIFVDAATGPRPGEIQIKELTGAAKLAQAPAFGHLFTPEAVVALAVQLYGASPRAFCATMTGQNFDHGDSLSPVVTSALPAFIARIEALVNEFLSDDAPRNS